MSGHRRIWFRSGGWLALAVVAVGGLALLPWGGNPLVQREQELRVILTARDMAEGGDWLVPHYLGEPRLNKPPLMYWMTAGFFRFAGTTQSPALARLPNAIFGTALLLAILGFGGRLVGRRPAFLAALIAGTSHLFLCFGRLCETDIPLACFEAVSLFALYAAIRTPFGSRWWWLSGLAAGLGFMVKGPAALFLPLAAGATFLFLSPDARQALRPARVIVWLLLVLAIACPWYALVFLTGASPAASSDIRYELGALLKHSAHAGTPAFYLYTLPAALLPWGLLLPLAVVALWRKARHHAAVRFLLAWLLSSLVVMSAVKSRQTHYATLLLAPSALLMARYLHTIFLGRPARRAVALRFYAGGVLTVLAVAGIACMALPIRFSFLDPAACMAIGFAAAAMAGSGLVALRTAAPAGGVRALAAICATLLLLSGLYAWQLHEIAEPSRIVKEFASQARARMSPPGRVFLAGRRLNAMQYYMGTRIARAGSFDEGWAKAGQGDAVILASDARNPVPPPAYPPPDLIYRQGDVCMRLFVKPAVSAWPTGGGNGTPSAPR
jgi:4-amino-4-deoxy-L-arabinose transferase-like glycosyltransferase